MDALALIMTMAAYLLGSVSSAVLICRLLKLPDPRNVGSNNPGATNVLRIGGKGAAISVLLCDMLKGTIPVWGGVLSWYRSYHSWRYCYRGVPWPHVPNFLPL